MKTAEGILRKHIISLTNGSEEDWIEANKEHPEVLQAQINAMNEYLIEKLTDYGVFQYCKFNPSGGIESNLIKEIVNKYLKSNA